MSHLRVPQSVQTLQQERSPAVSCRNGTRSRELLLSLPWRLGNISYIIRYPLAPLLIENSM